MSRFEERIMELIHQLREEIRMNDQRIKQLSGGSGGGIDLTAIMLKAIYDQDEDGIVDNAKRLDGYTLEEILSQGGGGGGSGDMLKAVYDTDNDGVVDNAEKLEGHPASDFAEASHQHSEADLNLSDVETGNASTQRHGFCPKLPGDSSKFFDGSGNFSVPELHGGGVLDTDIRYEEQNDILFYHEPTSKWMNLSRFKGVLINSYELLATYSSSITEGICASEDAVFGTYIDEIYKFTKTGSLQVGKVITSVDGCNRAEDMFYYNGVVYVVQNNYPSTPRKAYVVKYRSSDLQYLGYITLYNNHYATTIARDDNGHWWLTGGANPVYIYHYDENWNFINSQTLVPNLGTYGYQGIFWRRGHLYANTHYGNDDQYLDIFSYDSSTDTFTRIARASHYIDGNQNGQGVKPDPVEQDVLWWVKSQHGAHIKTKVIWSTSSVPFSLFNISFANGKAQMATEPTDNSDIATKKYVDDKPVVTTFDALTDTPSSKVGAGGKLVAVKADGSALEYINPPQTGAQKFTELTDAPQSYSGQGTKLVRVKQDETGLEFVSPAAGGVSKFTDLTDTPSSYSGASGKVVRVKTDESGVEFADPSTPGAHHTTHEAGGSDAIKLDDLASPDDNTDLNVSTSAHGLCPKLPNDSTKFLSGFGTWLVPSVGRNLIINENFDGLTVGNIAGQGSYQYATSWVDVEETGYANVVVKGGSDKHLEIACPASITQNIKTTVSNRFGLTPGFRVGYKIKSNTDASGHSGGVLVADAGGTTRASVRFGYNSGWKLRFYNGSTFTDIMSALKDTWYQVDMIFFPGASGVGFVLVFIDGVYKGVYSSTQITASGKGLQEIRAYWAAGTSPSALYVDDLIVEVYHALEA